VRVLVTGAGGFAGPWVVAALRDRGHDVTVLVRGTPPAALAAAGVAVERADLLDAPALAAAVAAARPDGVVHLAGVTFVPDAERRPAAAYRGNLEATLGLLAALEAAAPRARLRHVSSSEVFGAVARDELPVTERTPFRPLTVYGASKAAGELAAAQWGRARGVDVVVARPFNHTGPGQPPRFVCSALARQVAAAEQGRQPPVLRVGNMDPVRDFTDVRDVAVAYALLLERGRGGEAYNVCSGVETSVADVIAILRTLARIPLAVRRDPALYRPLDVERVVGSGARATADVGFAPTRSVETTLADLLAWWRATPDATP